MKRFFLSLVSLVFLSTEYSSTFASCLPGEIANLSSQEQLDSFVARRASALFTHMNVSEKFQFLDHDEAFSTPSNLWDLFRREPSELGFNFKTKAGAKPSVALKDFFEKGGRADCKLAHALVMHMITCELLGDIFFDVFYHKGLNIFPVDLPIGYAGGKGLPSRPGQSGYCCNVKEYKVVNPNGADGGLNIFCVGQNLYTGFGQPFSNGPKTDEKMRSFLYAATISGFTGGEETEITRLKPSDQVKIVYKLSPTMWETRRSQEQALQDIHGFDYNITKKLRTVVGALMIACYVLRQRAP